jgi:Pentapeptide repeats (8 copies)/WD domain, G-beta repeat
VLRDTVWAGKRLAGLDLTGADLTGADLRRTRLDRVELAGARLAGAQLAEARLTRVGLTGADLTGADLTRARLADVDLADATVAGSTWSRAAVLGGAAAGQAGGLAELGPAAVVGRDRAEPQLAAIGEVQAVAAVAGLGMIAVARGRSVELVDLASRQPTRVLTGHTGRVWSVAAVPLAGGRVLLASGGDGGAVRLWDPVTGSPVGDPLAGHPGGVWSVAAVPLAGGRVLLASGGYDGAVRLWLLISRESRRTAPALRPAEGARAGQSTKKRRAVIDAARAAFGLREAPSATQTAEPTAAEPAEHPVPEVEAEHVATIVTSRKDGWATVLPDGRSYKSAGDVSDVLWWAVKLCRFEAGELDPYDPSIHHLPHPQPIL